MDLKKSREPGSLSSRERSGGGRQNYQEDQGQESSKKSGGSGSGRSRFKEIRRTSIPCKRMGGEGRRSGGSRGLDRRIGINQRNQEEQDARKSSILLSQRVWKEWENKMDDQENQEAIHLTYRKSERGARRGVYLLNDQR